METSTLSRAEFSTRLKRFFKAQFGIAVRVSTNATKNPYIDVRIPPDKNPNPRADLTYSKRFDAELGRRCMGVIYGTASKIGQQSWGGNVGSTSIAMKRDEWEKVLVQYVPPPATGVGLPTLTVLDEAHGPRHKILDWTGKDVYPGKTFDDLTSASDFLTEDQRQRNPGVSDDEFESIIGEFHIEPING